VDRRGKVLTLLLFAIAVPATAHTFGFPLRLAAPAACLTIGNDAYRVTQSGAYADYRVRIDPAAASPDIRIALVSSPDEADFVLVDDGDNAPACHARGVRKVKIDADAPDAVVAIAASTAPADYRIFVRSRFVSPEAAAAMFAAAHMPTRLVTGTIANR
jgi:hypothetical protein